jgi:hypothetical protein
MHRRVFGLVVSMLAFALPALADDEKACIGYPYTDAGVQEKIAACSRLLAKESDPIRRRFLLDGRSRGYGARGDHDAAIGRHDGGALVQYGEGLRRPGG